jgi:hypothetical protein
MNKIYLERKGKLSGLICLPGNEHAIDITCQVISMPKILPGSEHAKDITCQIVSMLKILPAR